jgi:hypothetical protein
LKKGESDEKKELKITISKTFVPDCSTSDQKSMQNEKLMNTIILPQRNEKLFSFTSINSHLFIS